MAIVVDDNGIQTLLPAPSGAGGGLLLENDALLSTFVTSLTASIAAINVDTVAIATNTSDIATNVADIAAIVVDTSMPIVNAADIATNVTDIATNTSGIATNKSDIATNTSDISTNISDISTNTSDIATNTSDIGTNVTGISDNVTDIAAHTLAYDAHVANQTAAFVNVLNGDATGDGSTDDKAAIDASVAVALASGAGLLFPSGSYKIESDLTFTVPCLFMGGVLKPDSGIIVMFNKPIDVPLNTKCFDVAYTQGLGATSSIAAGDTLIALPGVRFDESSGQPFVRPQWWGAISDNSTDSADEIQQAIDSVSFQGSNNYTTIPMMVPGGQYAISHEIFMGYDFRNYDQTGAYLCWRVHAESPASRMNNVPFTSDGSIVLRYTGTSHENHQHYGSTSATNSSTKYLVYLAPISDVSNTVTMENVFLDAEYERRGFYIEYLSYSSALRGLTARNTREVGFDISECYTISLGQLRCSGVGGIGFRIRGCQGVFDNMQHSSYQQFNGFNDLWPDPDETYIRQSTGTSVQTSVDHRSAYWFGVKAVVNYLAIENSLMGWPYLSVYGKEIDGKHRFSLKNHQFEVGNKFYYEDDSISGVYDYVAHPTTSSYIYLDGATGGETTGKLYRVCESITQDATMGVVSILNHRFAEGVRIKFRMAGAAGGMEELDGDTIGWLRAGPSVVMSGTDDHTGDPVTTKLVDTAADFSSIGVGGRVYNLATGASGVITSISQTTNPNDTVNFSAGLTGPRSDTVLTFTTGNAYRVFSAMDDDSFGLYEFYRDNRGALVPLPTPAGSFSASNATEYIMGGGGCAWTLDGSNSTFTNFRAEGDSVPFAYMIIPDGKTGLNVSGFSNAHTVKPRNIVYGDPGVNPSSESVGTFNHLNHNIENSRVAAYDDGASSGCATNAIVEFDIALKSFAAGNRVTNVVDITEDKVPALLFTHPVGASVSGITYADGERNYGYQSGNKLDGVEISIERWQHDDATPPARTDIDPTYFEMRLTWTKFRIDDHTVDITNFDDGYEGQEITVFCGSNTNAKDIIHDVAKIVTTSGGDITPSAGDLLRFMLIDDVWYQS